MFLISSYGAPLAQRAFYLAQHVLSLGQIIMIILSLTTLTLCLLAQDVFPMAHTLTIVGPIWHMFQNLSKTLLEMHSGYDKSGYTQIYVHLIEAQGSCNYYHQTRRGKPFQDLKLQERTALYIFNKAELGE